MMREITNDQNSHRATSRTPRRNALVPDQGESSRQEPSRDRDQADQPRHEASSPGNKDKEPPKPLPHPATPPRPPRPDGRTMAERLEDWKHDCYHLRNDTNQRAKQRYQGSIDFTTKMIETSEPEDFVKWFRAYCDLKPSMATQDGEKLASVMVDKVRTEQGFVEALMQEQVFQDLIDEREYAKAVINLFGAAITGGVVMDMGQ
ncbi:MAG: hypothetical protein Q9184_003158 [Pyrenodesmia sp. 2 TL-2023]